MPAGRAIFNAADKRRLNETLRMIADLLPELDRAEVCGVECQDLRTELERTRLQLQAIRDNFMSKRIA